MKQAEKDKEKYGQKRCWIFSGLLSALFVERYIVGEYALCAGKLWKN